MFLIRVVVVDVDDNLIDRRYNMSVEPSLTPEHILYPSHAFVDGAARRGAARHGTTRHDAGCARGPDSRIIYQYYISALLYVSLLSCTIPLFPHDNLIDASSQESTTTRMRTRDPR